MKARLYGSFLSGTATLDSDVNFELTVDVEKSTLKLHEALFEAHRVVKSCGMYVHFMHVEPPHTSGTSVLKMCHYGGAQKF